MLGLSSEGRPFGGRAPPAAMFYYLRDRGGEHPVRHLADYAGILQADAYGGYNKLYEADRRPGPITEAGCWVHARRPFFVLADIAANARRKAQGKTAAVISPLALEAVRRIDALFEIERSINGDSPERRRAARQVQVHRWSPICETWLREETVRQGHRAATIWPRRWTTCSSAGRPSRAFWTTDGFASATMRPNEHCAA